MTHGRTQPMWVGLLLAVLVGGMACAARGQDEKKAKGDGPSRTEAGTSPGTSTAKSRAKPRDRLPAYFSRVVTGDQREQIYSLQAKFNARIQDLHDQIAALLAERDEKVEAVLNSEQMAEVNKLRAAAKQRRKSRTTKPKGDPPAPAPDDTPAAP